MTAVLLLAENGRAVGRYAGVLSPSGNIVLLTDKSIVFGVFPAQYASRLNQCFILLDDRSIIRRILQDMRYDRRQTQTPRAPTQG
ncbi:hypothetical protein Q4485_08075 [Granulosicoccaceae sp. 1_MG-2023]|nr:hypothetical protein [Granulosicoccaceae sp. 1_MG-2023]